MGESPREVWRVIPYAPRYSVSNLGKVVNNRTGLVLKGGITNAGYHSVVLYVDHSPQRTVAVHRLVAEAFLKKDLTRTDVTHIDGHKLNNHLSNLEWATRSENVLHAYSTGLRKPVVGLNRQAVRIIETGMEFESQLACAKFIGGKSAGISNVLRGKSKHYLGYSFEHIRIDL